MAGRQMGAEQHLQSLEKWALNRFLRIIPVSSEHFAPTPLDSGVQGKTPVSRNVRVRTQGSG